VIAGPCVVESEELLRTVATRLIEIERSLPVSFIFKSSYRKANRTSDQSFTGIGDKAALEMMGRIRKEFGLPTLTDVHSPEEAEMAAEFCDVLQIPAFLARQSELLHAAGRTGRTINIKKGQFMAPEDMRYASEKVKGTGNEQVLLTERGTFFGYGDLVVDFRSLTIMKAMGYPVIYDATHSVQRPSQQGISGGDRTFIPSMVRAAVAAGFDGLFIETHPNPDQALSDKSTQLPLDQLEPLLQQVVALRSTIRPFLS